MMLREILAAATIAAAIPSLTLAQQFTATRATGVVMSLPGGGMAILDGAERVVVTGLVPGAAPASEAPDIRIGDVVTSFQGLANPTLPDLGKVYQQLAERDIVTLGLRRGAAAEHQVRFPRGKPGQPIAIKGGAAGAGAWATADQGAGGDLVIAGAHLAENDQGMPQVTHRTSDPAAAAVPLKTGDVVTAINGRSIAALAGLRKLYDEAAAGSEIRLAVTRDGRPIELTFTKPGA